MLIRILPYLFPLLLTACLSGNVREEKDLETYFDQEGLSGSFGLFDNGHGKFAIYNLGAFSDSLFTPGATFNIINALIALETGTAANDSMLLPADTSNSAPAACRQPHTLKQAFQSNCTASFQEIARRIGSQNMQRYIDTLGYGYKKGKFVLKNNLDRFWLDHSVKVTGDEQIGLVKKLYFQQLPLLKRTQQIVKQLLPQERNDHYRLSYYYSESSGAGSLHTGWLVGWVEENQHPFFFSLQTSFPPEKGSGLEAQLRLLKTLLKHQGVADPAARKS